MNREAERKRLVELLRKDNCCIDFDCSKCMSKLHCFPHSVADYLLENNIVVLPCKIGDTLHDASEYIYGIPCPEIYEVESDRMTIEKAENGDYLFTYEDAYIRHEEMGVTLFPTREQAEKALEGKGK